MINNGGTARGVSRVIPYLREATYVAALVSGANAPQSDVLERALRMRGVCRVDAAGWLPLVLWYTWGGALGSLQS